MCKTRGREDLCKWAAAKIIQDAQLSTSQNFAG